MHTAVLVIINMQTIMLFYFSKTAT